VFGFEVIGGPMDKDHPKPYRWFSSPWYYVAAIATDVRD
jgi:hypothetical protein